MEPLHRTRLHVAAGVAAAALLLAAAVVAAGRYRAAGSWAGTQDRSALVHFSHRTHLAAGVDCQGCHSGIQSSRQAADNHLGTMATCYACHDQSSTECAFCHKEPGPDYSAFVPAEREIRFDHALHLERGLACESCHRGLDQVDHAGREQMPTMADCLACHDGALAASNCEVCHSNLTALKPSTHTPEWLARHPDLARSAPEDCSQCHGARAAGVTDCQECHEGAVLARTGRDPGAHFAPFGPTAALKGKPQRLERVHALDYATTHSLDARGKEKDCQTCHEPATFCAECHRTAARPAQLRPQWHGGADWGAIPGGVGSGGGRHAALARRDLENCAACHDLEGADPTCLACHMDRSAGRGNDPRTHEPGYMRDVKGSWHGDLNAICYACHRPSPFSQPGFCTYCHGPRGGD